MKNWIIQNWQWLVGLLGAGTVAFLMNPKAYFRRVRNTSETEDLRAGIEKNKTIRAEMKDMHEDILVLQREMREVQAEMHAVKVLNVNLTAERDALRAERDALMAENESLKTTNKTLRAALDACKQNNIK